MSQTILLVEDNDDIRSALHSLLVHSGYDVVEATNGREALDLVRKHSPDLVLMDLAMPEVNGLDVAQILKEDPATAEIPLMALTASTWLAGDRKVLLRAGFIRALRKPCPPAELLNAVQELLPGPGEPLLQRSPGSLL